MKYEQFIKLVESEIPNALNNKLSTRKAIPKGEFKNFISATMSIVEKDFRNAKGINRYAFDKSDIEKRIGFLNSANLMYAFYDDLNESAIILANEIASTLIKSGYIP